MRPKFEGQIHTLGNELMKMAAMCGDAIQKSIKAFFSQDEATAKNIITAYKAINNQEKKIEKICLDILIQQQPVASDLRMVTAALKMVTAMERIGDQAADIAELTVKMAGTPYQVDDTNFRQLAAETIIIVLKAIESFAEHDHAKAQEAIDYDDVVDALFLKVKADLVDGMRTTPDHGEQMADLLMVSKYLERVADLAVNISEWVMFVLGESPKKGASLGADASVERT